MCSSPATLYVVVPRLCSGDPQDKSAKDYERCTGNRRFPAQLRHRLRGYKSMTGLSKPLVMFELLRD
jgi:hypothetical protein